MKGTNFSLSSLEKRFGRASFLTLVVFGLSLFLFSNNVSAQDRTGGATLQSGIIAADAARTYAQSIASTMPSDVFYSLPLESTGNPEQIATVAVANEFVNNVVSGNQNSTTAFNNAVNGWLAKAPNDTKLIIRASNNVLNVIRQ